MNSDVPIVMTIFATFGWIAYTISTNIRKANTARHVAQLHARLLDKCATSQDVVAYLESTSGRKFLESAAVEGSQPLPRILAAMQSGFILALVGAAALIVRGWQINPDTSDFLLVAGAIVLAIGTGFLLSAVVSFALSKSWGLLNPAR